MTYAYPRYQGARGAACHHRKYSPGHGQRLRPVLATPAVAALIEKTCWQSVAAELELDQGTVGTALTLAHTAPTPVGMVVQCDCELTAVEDRRLCFTARVYDDVTEVATATHERYIVDNERFTRKANSKLTAK